MKQFLLTATLLSLASSAAAQQPEASGRATHYGVSYHGQRMGCPGAGRYSTYDPTIIAVPPSRYAQWPCGTALVVSGPGGTIIGTRQDACPGCDAAGVIVDLSEEGHRRVCGVGTCWVTVARYATAEAGSIAPPPPPTPTPQPEPEPDDWSGGVDGGPYRWGDWRVYVR